MTPEEQARRLVEEWWRCYFPPKNVFETMARDDLVRRLVPVFERAQDGMSVVAGAAIERAERAEAEAKRVRWSCGHFADAYVQQCVACRDADAEKVRRAEAAVARLKEALNTALSALCGLVYLHRQSPEHDRALREAAMADITAVKAALAATEEKT